MTGQNRSSAVMQQRIEPQEAKKLRLRWYFTGEPCCHGHVAKRNIANGECRRCISDRAARKRKENPDPFRQRDRARHRKNPDVRREQARKSREKHIEKRREEDRLRYRKNPERTKRNAVLWSRKNKGKRAAIIAARRAWIKRATPGWLTKDQHKEIRTFYLAAAAREGEWHVDHVVPLRGKTVCGLNVPWNLQLLTGDENRRKRNTHAE